MTVLPLAGAEGAAIDDAGVWTQVFRRPESVAGRPALFLDRDGVVVEEVPYLHRVEETFLAAGVADVIVRANRLGLPVVLVTNQSGIGRGIYGWPEFAAVQRHIVERLASRGATVDAVFACPHVPRPHGPIGRRDHPDRKPNPGMLLRAAALGVDLATSWIVGDRAADLEAGKRAGIAGGVHVLMGIGGRPGERARALSLAGPGSGRWEPAVWSTGRRPFPSLRPGRAGPAVRPQAGVADRSACRPRRHRPARCLSRPSPGQGATPPPCPRWPRGTTSRSPAAPAVPPRPTSATGARSPPGAAVLTPACAPG